MHTTSYPQLHGTAPLARLRASPLFPLPALPSALPQLPCPLFPPAGRCVDVSKAYSRRANALVDVSNFYTATKPYYGENLFKHVEKACSLPSEILNGALPHKMDIVTELWYEPEAAPPTPGTASASASGIRRPREPEPHGEKREHEEQHEPAGSPTAKARVDRDKKRKAEGEHEDEAERTRDIQSIEMALESLILEDRERESAI